MNADAAQSQRTLASDNYAPALPEVMAAVVAANDGHATAYGDDPLTARVLGELRDALGVDDGEVLLVFSGTGANVLALHALLRPYEAVVCASTAHVNVDETGAPERITGSKLLAVDTPDGKLTPALCTPHLRRLGDQHAVQPRVLSISQPTELGTLYTVDELRELVDWAHGRGARVHVDGARLCNAAAALDVPLAALCGEAGVDALCFGGTKAGLLGAEAVVLRGGAGAHALRFLRKQVGQLASKQRFLAAQLGALLQGELWRRAAAHANGLAQRLADGVRDVPGVQIAYPVQSNAVFARLPAASIEPLQRRCFFYESPDDPGLVRWMCSWDLQTEDVDAFCAAVREIVPPLARA